MATGNPQNVQDLSMGSISHPEYIQNPLLSWTSSKRQHLKAVFAAARLSMGSTIPSFPKHGLLGLGWHPCL
jgi:hypothetical protein